VPRAPHRQLASSAGGTCGAAAAALLILWLGAAGAPRAAGFASAEFGGELGNVVATNPTALYYNPAGIGFADGTHLYLDGVLALRRGTFQHAPVATDGADPAGAQGANSGRAHFANAFGAPMAGATTRIGNLAIGAAFSAPFGGSIRWDRNPRFAGDASFPLAADGPQRWTIIDGQLSSLYFTLGAAYRLGPLSVGVSGNLVRSSLHQSQAKNPTGVGDPDTANEGRDTLDVAGTQGSFGVGALLEAVRDRLWLGVSYQAQPGLGPMQLHGSLNVSLQGDSAPFAVTLHQALPDIIRLGGRYRPGPGVEMRLYGDVTRWSRFGTQCISLAGHACAVFANGADATAEASTVQNLRRLWRDTYGVRAGASVWARSDVELFAGLGYETAAVPDATLDPTFPDATSLRTALGARVQATRRLAFTGTFTSLWYLTRDNAGRSQLANAEPPTRRADAGGQYALWLGLVHLGIEQRF
jgi:long-chain fatty acid transport protein